MSIVMGSGVVKSGGIIIGSGAVHLSVNSFFLEVEEENRRVKNIAAVAGDLP
jgi:hypothetical protein